MENKEKKKKQEFYRSFAEALDLSWRIAITGTVIAGAIYLLATSCTKKSELEQKIETTHSFPQRNNLYFYIPVSLETIYGNLSQYPERENSAISS